MLYGCLFSVVLLGLICWLIVLVYLLICRYKDAARLAFILISVLFAVMWLVLVDFMLFWLSLWCGGLGWCCCVGAGLVCCVGDASFY